MNYKIKSLCIIILCSFSILFAQNIDNLIQELENEYELIDNIKAEIIGFMWFWNKKNWSFDVCLINEYILYAHCQMNVR